MIHRSPLPKDQYVILRNDVARDPRLSYRASGMLAEMLSRPANWVFSAERMAAGRPNGEGISAVRTGLKELERAGYLVRRRTKAADGKFGWTQELFDEPRESVEKKAPKAPFSLTLPDAPELVTPVAPPAANPRRVPRPRREHTQVLALAEAPAEIAPRRPTARNIQVRRTCVYRHFDADGTLLYVGITSSSGRRESGHLLSSIWHGMSASRTEEWFPNRTDAESAEMKAIVDEEPLFNIEGNASTRALLKVRRYLEARDLGALWEIHRRRVEFGQRPASTRKAKAPKGKVLAIIEE